MSADYPCYKRIDLSARTPRPAEPPEDYLTQRTREESERLEKLEQERIWRLLKQCAEGTNHIGDD